MSNRREREVLKALLAGPLNVVRHCLFPMWNDVEAPTHRYCGEATIAGSSYCAGHHATCWRPRVTNPDAKRFSLDRLAMLP